MARTLGAEAEVMEAGNNLRLLMLHNDDDVYLFPSFRLLGGKVVEVLQEVLLVLQARVKSPWAWAQWLNVTLLDEDAPRNITLLYEWRLEEELRDARNDAWVWSQ
ncbi:hypothetical protein LTA6_001881 [Microbacterium sp. LTA6]|uniref:hypothetical protein n=1 Tax=unclassified Microbacterium TaxID=2609290 RepID=UPI00324D1B73